MTILSGKRIVVTGGTGSLGQRLVRRIMTGELGRPAAVVVFSRDEAKQHTMRLAFQQRAAATDEVIFEDWQRVLRFQIGDVADEAAVAAVLRNADVVFNAAAMKQVPTCEYFPFQAVRTNVHGPEHIVRAILHHRLPVESVVAVSTDKACKPVNVMGMTKALQERIFIQANLECEGTRFVVARYGNVMASRGSVIPLFHEQIRRGGPLTLTTAEMTRFLMNLDQAVDTVFAALAEARPGETYIPRLPSARMVDVAAALIGPRPIETVYTGIRPGEKVHEILVSEEEGSRTVERGPYLAILPMQPELRRLDDDGAVIGREFGSADNLLQAPDVASLLRANRLLLEDGPVVTDVVLAG
jgi:FlaA1/EpsC-like NDP-sugar epimerase